MPKPFENIHSRAELETDSRRLATMLKDALPESVGFALFVFNFGGPSNVAYVANSNRTDMIQMLKEWLARMESSTPPDRVLRGQWTPDGIRSDNEG